MRWQLWHLPSLLSLWPQAKRAKPLAFMSFDFFSLEMSLCLSLFQVISKRHSRISKVFLSIKFVRVWVRVSVRVCVSAWMCVCDCCFILLLTFCAPLQWVVMSVIFSSISVNFRFWSFYLSLFYTPTLTLSFFLSLSHCVCVCVWVCVPTLGNNALSRF